MINLGIIFTSLANGVLKHAQIIFDDLNFSDLKKLFTNWGSYIFSSGRILFESVELNVGNEIVQIQDGELREDLLILHLVNKVDPEKWFQIEVNKAANGMTLSFSSIEVRKKTMSKKELKIGEIFNIKKIQPRERNEWFKANKRSGPGILQTNTIEWNLHWDSILRRGAGFTNFRHFQITEKNFILNCPPHYAEELICYMAYSK